MPREGDTKVRDGYIWEYKLTFVDDEDDEEFEWVNTGVREEVVSESGNDHPYGYAMDQEIYDSSITDEEIYEREKLKLESERRRDEARKRIEEDELIRLDRERYGWLDDETDLWGWIVNIISATGAIVGILGIFVILFDLMEL